MAEKIKFTDTRLKKIENPTEGQRYVWDADCAGLCVRLWPGSKTFWVQYRIAGKLRWYRIGDVKEVELEDARARAAEVRAQAREGIDSVTERKKIAEAPPPPKPMTVSELADSWLESVKPPIKKESSWKMDELYIRRYIKPMLGPIAVCALTPAQVEAMHRQIGNGPPLPRKATGKGSRSGKQGPRPYMANRVVACLSAIMTHGETLEVPGLARNPCRSKAVRRFPEQPRHRALNELELRRLAGILDAWPSLPYELIVGENGERKPRTRTPAELARSPKEVAARARACDAIRVLLLTGARRSEVAHARWGEYDKEARLLRLEDSKTGARLIRLNAPALAIIERQKRTPLNPFIFASPSKKGAPLSDLKSAWLDIRVKAGLATVRAHDLRHTCGETLASEGYSELLISKVLGHSKGSITQRYTDIRDDVVQRAVERYGEIINRALRVDTSKFTTASGEAAP